MNENSKNRDIDEILREKISFNPIPETKKSKDPLEDIEDGFYEKTRSGYFDKQYKRRKGLEKRKDKRTPDMREKSHSGKIRKISSKSNRLTKAGKKRLKRFNKGTSKKTSRRH
ncbi:MAG: hypothetical protein ABIG10_02215 [bacterium]